MKIRSFIVILISLSGLAALTGCQKGELQFNPNAATEATAIPTSLIINHLTANLIRSEEMPFGNDAAGSNGYKASQQQTSIYSKYWSNNEYSWSYTVHSYEILKYAVKLEDEAFSQLKTTNNRYFALSKFFRAYAAVWLSQRVGDIPMSEAGNPAISDPKFDTQKDVYKQSLALLDSANIIMGALVNPSTQGTVLDQGDIFGLTYLQWQKLINTYRLRVLISLQKRADDAADLNIKTQFAAIVGNSTQYPVMTGNGDNMVYKFNAAYNQYPNFASGSSSYNNFLNVGKTILDATTANKDPRTFLFATPAPALLAAPNNKALNDFTAYVGADPKIALDPLKLASDAGNTSYFNASRYFGSNTGATTEPFIFVGYPEMCFNIAEGINRGWTTLGAADAKAWYDKGIAASFKNLGLDVTINSQIAISDVAGSKLGTVTADMPAFLTAVSYDLGSSTNALTQILTQKYVAFFMNSGYEGFYNFRRTGIPVFSQGGPGIGTGGSQLIPRRWLYPLDEVNYNNANYKTSVAAQYGGTEDVNKDTWLTK